MKARQAIKALRPAMPNAIHLRIRNAKALRRVDVTMDLF
jgi:hypothetical protein